jgi:hypothetical protein
MQAATTVAASNAPKLRGVITKKARDAWRTTFRAVIQTLALLLTIGGAFRLAFYIATLPDHPLADMTHITTWVRNIQQHGVSIAYAGSYPETYMIYPPAMAHAYRAAGMLSETLPPLFGVPEEDWLRVCVKLVPIGGHIALALTLFAIVTAAGGFWRGWLAATLYAWNPAALFDAAYWGQGDSLNIALLAMAIGVLFLGPGWWPLRDNSGRWRWQAQSVVLFTGVLAGALMAASGLTKPQSWVFLPLILWLAFRRVGLAGLTAFIGAAWATALVIVRPWAEAGRLDEALSVFVNVTQVMPSVSANAHNLWWLKLPGDALAVFDTTPLGGIGSWVAPYLVTHATVGRLGFGLFALLPLLRLTGPLSVRLVLACVAYTSGAYFMTVTQAHENHMFAAVPFLAAIAVLDPWFIIPFAIASLSVFLNMALHDFLIGDQVAATLAQWLPWQDPLAIQTANAVLNVAGFMLLTLILLRRPPAIRQSATALLWRARFVLLTGLVLAGGALGTLLAILRNPTLADQLWWRVAERALLAGPLEVHLGRRTPPEVILERAALEFANMLYLLAGIAAVVGAVAAVAGLWWLVCARQAATRYDSYNS